MASGVIAKASNRMVKYFDVVVPSGNASYNFSSVAPSDYSGAKRLGAISIAGAGVVIAQLGAVALFFTAALTANATIRILYYVD